MLVVPLKNVLIGSDDANVGVVVSPDTPKKKFSQKKLIYIKDEAEQIRCT